MAENQTIDAPYGWVWLDDDGWEHSPSGQHPHERGEAEWGEQFRPATAEEATSSAFFRCPEVHINLRCAFPEHCGRAATALCDCPPDERLIAECEWAAECHDRLMRAAP